MDRWLVRIAIAALVAVILVVAAALGLLSRLGLGFYLAAVVVGLIALLIWFALNANRKGKQEDEQADADETTLPSYHDSISHSPPPSSGTH
jgi:hypothetical protein